MDIFRVIRSSIYEPAFYARIRSRTLWSTIKTFVILGLVGFGLLMLFAYIAIVPLAHSGLPDAVASAYPADLVVTMAKGELSINQPQPYYIKNTLPIFSGKGEPQNIAVFDGNDQLSSDLKQNSTFVIVKKQFAITQGRDGTEQVTPFTSYQSTTTIDQAKFVGMVDKVKPYFAPGIIYGGAVLLLLITLFGALFWVIYHGIYVLIPALLIFLISKLQKDHMKFSESYMVALYASVPIAILFYLLLLLSIKLPIPFAYTALLLIVAFINLSKAPHAEPPAAAPSVPVPETPQN